MDPLADDAATLRPPRAAGAAPRALFGGWEVGLIIFMILLYLGRRLHQPALLRLGTDASPRVLRDAARYGVMAVGMTFVIVNKDLDLSVGSLYGADRGRLLGRLRAVLFRPRHRRRRSVWAWSVGLRRPHQRHPRHLLRVPAFIATLTMLSSAAASSLGLSGGKTISFIGKGQGLSALLLVGENNAWGFNNQIFSSSSSPSSARSCSPRPARLPDLRDRRQRARRDLCRHPDPLGAHARLSALGLLRDGRRADAGGPGPGMIAQSGQGLELSSSPRSSSAAPRSSAAAAASSAACSASSSSC